jgi:hypothetical protein
MVIAARGENCPQKVGHLTRRFLSHLFACGLMMTLGSSGVHAVEHPRGFSDLQFSTSSLKSPPTPAHFVDAKACTKCPQAEIKGLGSNPNAKLRWTTAAGSHPR